MEEELLEFNSGLDTDIIGTDTNVGTDISDLGDDGLLGSSNHSIFDSGFDDEHPRPTMDQLQNAGFSKHMAETIYMGYYSSHAYSDKELYHCLYESEDPVKAYNDMMEEKAQDLLHRTDDMIKDIEGSGLLGSYEESDNHLASIYNGGDSDLHHSTHDSHNNELGTCDCRSECKYNTGESWKSSNYGYCD